MADRVSDPAADPHSERALKVPGSRIALLVGGYLAALLLAGALVTVVLGPPPVLVVLLLTALGGVLALSLRRQRVVLRPGGLSIVIGGFGVAPVTVAWAECSEFRLVRRGVARFAEATGAPRLPAGQWGMSGEDFVLLLNAYRDAAAHRR